MRQNADYYFGMAHSNCNTIMMIMLTVSIDNSLELHIKKSCDDS